MKINPKISVVIPSYNKINFIKRTLDSIVGQEYKNYEVIVQDGGSTDGSVEIIKKYAQSNRNILWESKKDKGQLDAINKGLRKASGDLLAFINADDVYFKNAFGDVVQAYNNNPESLWFVGKGNIVDDSERATHKLVTSYKNLLLKINSYNLLLVVNYITQPSVFITKKAYEKYGPFSGTKDYVMEYELWLKLGKSEMPTLINKTISSFRLVSGNISTTAFGELLKKDYQIAKKYTNDSMILILHKINNAGRVLIANNIK